MPHTILSQALACGALAGEDAVVIIDLDMLSRNVGRLRNSFPENALHAVAVKANPLMAVLKFLRQLGLGAEVASLSELHLALAAGYEPQRIVFDSPAKTVAEIEFALRTGVHINADNFAELARIADILAREPSSSTIGLRLNPQVGRGAIAAASVAGRSSKFGVPIELREEIVAAYAKYPWLTGVHLHIGSQGCALPMLLEGIGLIYDVVAEINDRAGRRQITVFDIGGGLPAAYLPGDQPPAMAEYADAVRERFPALFSGDFRLITEFGRHLHAPCGFAASRVEYVKDGGGGRKAAVIHLGADMFLRECYNPTDWTHEISVTDREGRAKSGPLSPLDVAGPLCFSGDYLARGLPLPPVVPGDWAIIHDVGAYTFSMWSRYNSRCMPTILGFQNGGFRVLKSRETLQDLVAFWS